MKNLLMIVLALVTLNASAQERKKEASTAWMKEKIEARQNMTPEQVAQLQTKKMTLHLDLTTSQQVEVEKLLVSEAKERKAKMEVVKANKESGEKPSQDERLKMQNERLDHQIAMKQKMKAILNADQYEKFDAMHSKREGNRDKKAAMRKQRN